MRDPSPLAGEGARRADEGSLQPPRTLVTASAQPFSALENGLVSFAEKDLQFESRTFVFNAIGADSCPYVTPKEGESVSPQV